MLSPNSTRTYVRLLFLASVVLISCILTARYKLAAPYNRPYGAPVNLGHQAYQIAFARPGTKVASAGAEGAVLNSTTGSDAEQYWDEDDDFLDDWGYSSGGSAKWDPLEQNSTPLTEIQVKTCILSPGLYDMCSPTSTTREDATRGKWVRIDKDVNAKVGVKYSYIYARRLLPGSNADVITDLRLLNHTPTANDLSSDGVWVEVSTSLREGVWPHMSPLFLHYKLTSQADIRAARRMDTHNASAGALEPITELDVLYGGAEVQPLPGYKRVERLITGGDDDPKRIANTKQKGTRVGSSLAYRKEKVDLPPAPVLRFSSTGNFTVLQVADLHFSVGPGECRDVDPEHVDECKKAGADVYSLKWLEMALDEVKPDLVVLSGDQLNGQETSWDAQSVVLKWAPLLYKRGVPWATIFGNHDHETTNLDRAAQMNLYTHLPYYLGEAGPTTVDGVGNYVRSIRAPTGDDTVLFNLYFLDSHAYEKKSLNPWAKLGYDYLKPNQINWFRGRSAQMHTLLRPYTPKSTTPSGSNRRPSSSSGSNRRPPRPRPGSKAESVEDIDRRRRIAKRQDDEEAGGDTWTAAELEELAEEIEKEDVAELAEEEGTYAPAVEPGSNVVDEPEDDVSFEKEDDEEKSSASETETQEPGEGGVSTPSETAEDELLAAADADEAWLEPTELAAGPTKANPLEAKPNAMVFFHIPLQIAYSSPIDVSPAGKRLRVGERLEGNGASKTPSGFFEQAILAGGELPAKQKEGGAPVDEFWDGESTSPTTGRPEVKVLAHGHCHITSDCRRVQGVWICFGGGGTYSGYGSTSFSRRMRVYQLSQYGERIETYQLTDTKEQVNRAVLYGEGSLEEQ
ncbi:hypothetical protein JCM8097_006363 [Rhodosporidiobolus ruineniae]